MKSWLTSVRAASASKVFPDGAVAAAMEIVSFTVIDVDTASYSFVRRSLKEGTLPDPGTVRVEDSEGLLFVGLGIREHLFPAEDRPGAGTTRGITNHGGEIANHQHRQVAEVLELAQLG